MTDDIFISEILGHKLLPGACRVVGGTDYKDFYRQIPKIGTSSKQAAVDPLLIPPDSAGGSLLCR
jgi:hypothetical protein